MAPRASTSVQTTSSGLSKHHARITVYIDWSVGTPAHNKDMSDAECGGAKHDVDQ